MHSTVYNVKGVEASNNLFNLLKKHDPDRNTSWFELGERAGIEIVDEEEVDAEVQEIEEDKEVKRIYNDAKDKHRRMLTGTCIFSVLLKVSKVLCMEYYVLNHTDTCCLMLEVSKVHCMECKRMNGIMSEVSKEIKYKHVLLYVAAIRTVAAGHKMISDGWNMFEKTCLEVGTGELPQLLRSLKLTTTPTSTPIPTPAPTTPVKEEQEDEGDVTMVKEETEEGVTKEEPVYIPLGNNKYKYGCGNCNITPMASKNGMDAHIHKCHTKKALVCSFCMFSTYNYDSLNGHAKDHN